MITTEHIERLLVVADGFPRPKWEEFATLVEALAEDEQSAAWELILRTWLSELAGAISDEAMVFAGNGLLLLASSSADQGEELLTYSVRTLTRIRTLLGGLPPLAGEWTPVLIVFADIEQFYDYVDYFHAEDGEYGGAGGMFLASAGYPHVVVGPGEPWVRQSIIAHELTHDYLYGRDLPLWLEEGLTQTVQETSLGAPLFLLDRELCDRHQRFWSAQGLGEFWSGAGFVKPGEIQELSYQLALTLLRAMISQHAERVGDFVAQASWRDAGEAAAVAVLGRSLSAFAAGFLGDGDWSPGDYTGDYDQEPDAGPLQIRTDDLRGPEVAALLQEHLDSVALHSPPESIHALDLDALRAREVTFWSGWQGSKLVGCAALKELDAHHGEIKSMRTSSSHLRRGVATALLEHMISVARERAYRRLSLETGAADAFSPARALYARFGFEFCGPFADYVEDPHSVFMTCELET